MIGASLTEEQQPKFHTLVFTASQLQIVEPKRELKRKFSPAVCNQLRFSQLINDLEKLLQTNINDLDGKIQ